MSDHDLKTLLARLRERASFEESSIPDDADACEGPPEITWGELAKTAALLREAAEALERLSPERAPWQPIETAPKNADVLLLYLEGSGVQPGYWENGEWLACETQSLTGGRWHAAPTRWLPPPAAPGAEPPADQSLSFSDPQKARVRGLLMELCQEMTWYYQRTNAAETKWPEVVDRLLAQEVKP